MFVLYIFLSFAFSVSFITSTNYTARVFDTNLAPPYAVVEWSNRTDVWENTTKHQKTTTERWISNRALPEMNALFPFVGDERRQIMNWDDTYLRDKYEDSEKDKRMFLASLREEFMEATELVEERLLIENDTQSNENLTLIPSGRYNEWRPEEIRQSLLNEIVDVLNEIRSTVDPTADEMIKLSWDYDLESSAWQKVMRCYFTGRRSYVSAHAIGENLWIGWGEDESYFRPTTAIRAWQDESKFFDPRLQVCLGGPCENFVQMIWYRATKVGCAWTNCENVNVYGVEMEKAVYMACHFRPRSIRLPFLAYYKGIPCSFCAPEDGCSRRLCTNSERENVTGTPPMPSTSPDSEGGMAPEVMATIIVFLVLIAITVTATAAVYITAKCMRDKKCDCDSLLDFLLCKSKRRMSTYDEKQQKRLQQGGNFATSESRLKMHVSDTSLGEDVKVGKWI